ncbi:MAG TPA: MarR family transcriptional regulator [Alphaproteobacteria bacterium]|jgi:DNA-binding MarR family transcriptional regulator
MRGKHGAQTDGAQGGARRARGKDAARARLDRDEPFDLYKTPGFLVRRLHQIVVSACYEGWGDLDISPVQYGALMAVRAFPGIDQRGLARAIAIDRSSIGTVSGQLERRGLIARRTGTRDKRNKELFLTAKGAAVLRRAHPLAWEIQDRILAPLDARERRVFVGLLAKLVERNNALSRAPLEPTGFEAD